MDKFEAIRLYGLASNFWQLTLNVASEMIKRGNPSSMRQEGWDEPTTEEYEEHTKWSDLNIIEPTLFNFYHGIELSLKSLIRAKDAELKNDHKLSQLLDKVRRLYENEELIAFYEKYINKNNAPAIIKNFCQESGMTMDLYFQSLKYPTSTKGVEFNHSSLRGHDEDGVVLFQEISNDLKCHKKEMEKQIFNECKDVIT